MSPSRDSLVTRTRARREFGWGGLASSTFFLHVKSRRECSLARENGIDRRIRCKSGTGSAAGAKYAISHDRMGFLLMVTHVNLQQLVTRENPHDREGTPSEWAATGQFNPRTHSPSIRVKASARAHPGGARLRRQQRLNPHGVGRLMGGTVHTQASILPPGSAASISACPICAAFHTEYPIIA